MALFVLNVFICIRLVRDEVPRKFDSQDTKALFYYFQARCNTTAVEFEQIYKNGSFLELPKDSRVPNCRCRLYLVIEGVVECKCRFHGDPTEPFLKRSGQFFDLRMFNLFTFPIGFDNTDFEAVTLTDTKLFMWDLEGLENMRKVPLLGRFWEFVVIRSLAAAAVRHHLIKTETLCTYGFRLNDEFIQSSEMERRTGLPGFDSLCTHILSPFKLVDDALLIPEADDWLEGAPSRDFVIPVERPPTILRQLQRLRRSFQVIPPPGVRQYVCIGAVIGLSLMMVVIAHYSSSSLFLTTY